MRVLVTGGLGFVGRAVAVELLRAGHTVDVLTRGRSVAPPKGATVVVGDVRHAELGGYDGYCHLAGLINPRESLDDPLTYWDVNVVGTINLLRAAVRTSPRFVLASTNLVYGSGRDGTLSEDLTPSPDSPYARSKLAAEQAVRDVAEAGRIQGTTLRVFNAAGAYEGQPDVDQGRLIPNVLRAARDGTEVTVNGDGTVVRDYTHVVDVAAAFRLGLEAEGGNYAAYNVGTGVGASVLDIIAVAREVTGREIRVRHLPPKAETPTSIADPRRIREALGWQAPNSTLREILRSAWEALPQAARS